MITYKESDIISSSEDDNLRTDQNKPMTCGYVKEEAFDSEENVMESDDELDANSSHLHRRKRDGYEYDDVLTKTRCSLLLVADYRFFSEMGGNNSKTTTYYLVRLWWRLIKFC